MTSTVLSPLEVVRRYKTIAVIGVSKNPEKDAHSVPLYLKEHGYRIIPINPTTDQIFGDKAYHSLLEIPDNLAKEVEVVLVFRPSEELPEVARQVVELKRRDGRPFVFWSQLGIESEEAKRILDEGNILHVMNMCMRVIHGMTRSK